MALSDNMRGMIYMNVAMLAFCVNDSFMKAVTHSLPLYQAIALRGVLSLAGLLIIAAFTTGQIQLLPQGKDKIALGLRTVGEVAGTVLFLTALTQMPLANLSAIMQSLPLAVTLVAALAFGEQIGWRRMLAITVGFGGVMMIIRPGTDGFDKWSLMGLGSVGCVVLRDLATRQLSPAVPSVTVAIWAAFFVMVMGIIGTAMQGWNPVSLHQALLIFGAALALVVGYMFVVMVMRVGDLGFVAPFRYMALLWAILFGWVLFQTLPDKWTLRGAAIVVATGIYTLWRERKLRLAKAAAV